MTASNLTAGVYTVSIIDANGCTTFASVEIPELIGLGMLMLSDDVTCYGESSGEARPIVWGGTPPYSFQWDDAAGTTDSLLANVAVGIYNIVITDQNGCTITETVHIEEPPMMTAVMDAMPVSCYGLEDGVASVNSSGGSFGHSYQWSDPDMQTGTVAINLAAGPISVTITDGYGCSLVTSTVVAEAPQIEVAFDVPEALCLNEMASFAAIANADYYFWEFGSDAMPQVAHEATVDNVSWITSGLKTATVTVTEDGCTLTENFTVLIEECPEPFVDSLVLALEEKADGTVELLWRFTEDGQQASYVLEVSNNNQPYKHLHTMDARSAGLQFYFWEDATPIAGWNKYRLRRVNSANEMLETTAQIFIEGEEGTYLLFPNPAEDEVFLTAMDEIARSTTFSLFSSTGKAFSNRLLNQDDHQIRMDLRGLSEGIYFIVQKDSRGDVVGVYRVIKM